MVQGSTGKEQKLLMREADNCLCVYLQLGPSRKEGDRQDRGYQIRVSLVGY